MARRTGKSPSCIFFLFFLYVRWKNVYHKMAKNRSVKNKSGDVIESWLEFKVQQDHEIMLCRDVSRNRATKRKLQKLVFAEPFLRGKL